MDIAVVQMTGDAQVLHEESGGKWETGAIRPA